MDVGTLSSRRRTGRQHQGALGRYAREVGRGDFDFLTKISTFATLRNLNGGKDRGLKL